jgi:hypothetical protein
LVSLASGPAAPVNVEKCIAAICQSPAFFATVSDDTSQLNAASWREASSTASTAASFFVTLKEWPSRKAPVALSRLHLQNFLNERQKPPALPFG